NAGIGVTGANLGTTASGIRLGTVFDDQATRRIVDINANNGARGAAAPFTGHFRPELGSLDGAYGGATVSQVNGTWTLRITDNRSSNGPTQSLANWAL